MLWRKREKRSKEKREGEDDQEGIWDRQEGKERKLIKEDIGRRGSGSLGRKVFFEDQSSRLRVLLDDDCGFFH